MRKSMIPLVAAASSIVLVAGCATANSMRDARESLAKAKTSGAETGAPADYYMAEAYFRMAEHEVREGDNSKAKEMAGKSLTYSDRAIMKAGGGAK